MELFEIEQSFKLPALEKAINAFTKSWKEEHSIGENKLLYHYTTAEGLKGIIQNRSLWLTEISTLNDPQEMQYGKNIITEIITEYIDKEVDANIKKMLTEIRGQLWGLQNKIMFRPFVSCFCSNGNLLSQWRGYSGKGYNIGFELKEETKYSNDFNDLSPNPWIEIRRVIYDAEKQKKYINDYIQQIISGAKTAFGRINGNIRVGLSAAAALVSLNMFLDMMLSMKSPHFKEEDEWRLIGLFPPDRSIYSRYYEYTVRNGMLVPHLNTYIFEDKNDTQEFSLISIMHSPMLDEKAANDMLNVFLNSAKELSHKIRISDSVKILNPDYFLKES
jgi:hypothetical protein